MKITILVLMSVLLAGATSVSAETKFIKYKKYLIPITQACDKPKVIVTTDYGPLPTTTTKVGGDSDANEVQDMVHFLAYSDLFDVRGLIVTKFHSSTDTSDLNSLLTSYGNDSSFFNSSGIDGFPSEQDLKSVLYLGVNKQGSASTPKKNAAIDHIIAEAGNASPACPLNILVWGAITDTASAVHHMSANDRDNLRIIAIGSTNRSSDTRAWAQIKAYKDAGNTEFSKNIIFVDGRGNNDAFRKLFLGGNCGVNPRIYNDSGVSGRVEYIMNDLSDNRPTSDSGLRGQLQKSRGSFSSIRLANWHNCQASSSSSANSLRMADFLTTLYLLDEEIGFNGAMREIIENNDSSSSTGTANHAVRRQVYEHYRARMNSIY